VARRIRLAVGAGALGAVTLLGMAGAVPASADSAAPAAASSFVSDINQLRASHGLGLLTVSPTLTSIAGGWSEQMSAAGSISHNPSLAAEAPSGWAILGENVGVGGNEPSLQQAFTNSPEHYANMVNPRYSEIGVSVVVTTSGTMYVTEDYVGMQAASPPVSAPVSAPVPQVKAAVVPAAAPAAPAPLASPHLPAPPVAAAPAVSHVVPATTSTTAGDSANARPGAAPVPTPATTTTAGPPTTPTPPSKATSTSRAGSPTTDLVLRRLDAPPATTAGTAALVVSSVPWRTEAAVLVPAGLILGWLMRRRRR
jgi:hypothetical protein